MIPEKAFSRVNKGIQRVNLLQIFMALMAQLEPTFLGRGLLPTPHALLCTCLFSSSTLILFRQFCFSLKSFGLPARHVLRENMFEGAFPQFSGFQIAACFGVITACLGVNAACFPGRPKN